MEARRLAQAAVRRLGYQFSRWPAPGSHDAELQKVLKDLAVTTVIDVGGHEGLFGLKLRSLGYTEGIVSFEPSRGCLRTLRKVAEGDRSWRVEPVALGDLDTSATFFEYAEHNQLSSLHLPSRSGVAEFGMTVSAEYQVPVRRLDSFQLGITGAVMLKIDTQGHDDAVLMGGRETVKRSVALQVELSTVGVYERAPKMLDLIEIISNFGFDLVGLFPVHEPRWTPAPLEFDGLFVRAC